MKLLILFLLFPALAAAEIENRFYFQYGISTQSPFKIENQEIDATYVSKELTIGYSYFLNNDWKLRSELSLENANVSIIDRHGSSSLNGLWIRSILQNEGLFEQVKPFFGVSVGRVKLNLNDGLYKTKYRALGGISFKPKEKNYSLQLMLGQ